MVEQLKELLKNYKIMCECYEQYLAAYRCGRQASDKMLESLSKAKLEVFRIEGELHEAGCSEVEQICPGNRMEYRDQSGRRSRRRNSVEESPQGVGGSAGGNAEGASRSACFDAEG